MWEGKLHIALHTGETQTNPLFFSQHPSPTTPCFLPLPPASPLSSLCLTLAVASPKPLCDARAMSCLWFVGPTYPSRGQMQLALPEACAWGSLHRRLPQSQAAYQRVLLFMVEFFKNSSNQAGLLGEAEGEAGKRCCTENRRFSKDMEKAGVFVPTSPLSCIQTSALGVISLSIFYKEVNWYPRRIRNLCKAISMDAAELGFKPGCT